jgi:hypothetical protein
MCAAKRTLTFFIVRNFFQARNKIQCNECASEARLQPPIKVKCESGEKEALVVPLCRTCIKSNRTATNAVYFNISAKVIHVTTTKHHSILQDLEEQQQQPCKK